MLRLGKGTHTYLGHYNNLHKSGSLASVKTNLAMRKQKITCHSLSLWQGPQTAFQWIPVKTSISPHCPLLRLPCWLTGWVNIYFPGYLRQSLHNQRCHLYRFPQKLNTSLDLIRRYISNLCSWTQLAYCYLQTTWEIPSILILIPSPVRWFGTARIHTGIKSITFLFSEWHRRHSI